MLSSRQLLPVTATVAAVLVAVPTVTGQAVIFVDDDAPLGGNGATWGTAYRFVQDALAFAGNPGNAVSEIRVGQGTYRPDRDEAHPSGTGVREATFALIEGVTIAGGFAGFGAADPDARDIDVYRSVLSGDLLGNDAETSCCAVHETPGCIDAACQVEVCLAIPECCASSWDPVCVDWAWFFCANPCAAFSDNSHSVVTATNIGATAVLDGLFIAAGNADAGGEQPLSANSGGGLFNEAASPTVRGCRFLHNRAFPDGGLEGYGGAVANLAASSPLLTECRFEGNIAIWGAAVANLAGSDATIQDCDIERNYAGWGGIAAFDSDPVIGNCLFADNLGAVSAGGVYAEGASTPSITDCTFVGNLSRPCCSQPGGAALRLEPGTAATLTSCLFTGNSVIDRGGSTFLRGGAVVNASAETLFVSCTFDGNSVRLSVITGITGQAFGGAVYDAGAARYIDCQFTGNRAEGADARGGAMYDGGAGGTLLGCGFTQNTAAGADHALGGGLYLQQDGGLVVGCTFTGNAVSSQGDADGGAFYLFDHSSGLNTVVIDSSFVNNTGETTWVTGPRGGAIYYAGQNLILTNSVFAGNATPGQYAAGGALSVDFGGRATATNCLFFDNESGNVAGAVWVRQLGSATSLALVNCTIATNTAVSTGGVRGANGADMDIDNCILWANSDSEGSGEVAQLVLSGSAADYSCIQGLTGDLGGVGNIGDDPMFVDPANGDFRLQAGSPCVDAGHNWAVTADSADLDNDLDTTELMPFDLGGNPRFVHATVGSHPGCGVPAIVDMGAYEFPKGKAAGIKLGDIDGDGTVGMFDLVSLIISWGPAGGGCQLADFDLDGLVAVPDLLTLLANWG